jgi:hypothetical protein
MVNKLNNETLQLKTNTQHERKSQLFYPLKLNIKLDLVDFKKN